MIYHYNILLCIRILCLCNHELITIKEKLNFSLKFWYLIKYMKYNTLLKKSFNLNLTCLILYVKKAQFTRNIQ